MSQLLTCARRNCSRLAFRSISLLASVGGMSKDGKTVLSRPGLHQQPVNVGEDSFVMSSSRGVSLLGVADGVGGWRDEGVDPAIYSLALMSECQEALVNREAESKDNPRDILNQAYQTVMSNKRVKAGSCTVCLGTFSHQDGRLKVANLGDSGFALFRGGQVVAQSSSQQHYFNAPYQLGKVGAKHHGQTPSQSDLYDVVLQLGDMLLMATDGLWDNVRMEDILSALPGSHLVSEHQLTTHLSELVQSSVLLSQQEHYWSPFAEHAAGAGYQYRGGKVDDITVVMAAVVPDE